MDHYPSVNRYYANGNRQYMDLYFLTLKGRAIVNKKSLDNKKDKYLPKPLCQKQLCNEVIAFDDKYFLTLKKMSQIEGREASPINEYY